MAEARPFGEIALSLSGGGYRAAAFHLGSLDILHRTGILRDVSMLSTVSGGTFVGAAYALAAGRGDPFEDFFTEFYKFLRDSDLPGATLQELQREQRKVIVAAAQVYDELLFKDARLGQLDGTSHLQEIIFNATEMRTGVAFRFLKSRISGARIGNGNVWIDPVVAANLRLADIAAASSCFPGGFEPIVLPDDFKDAPAGLLRTGKNVAVRPSIALMDGGIVDNQGIGSLLLADDRDRLRSIGLFIISDTTQINEEMLAPNVSKGSAWWARLTIGFWRNLLTISMTVAGVGLIIHDVKHVSDVGWRWRDATMHLSVGIMTALSVFNLWLWFKFFQAFDGLPMRLRSAARKVVSSLPLGFALDRGLDRLKSLMALASDVFLHRVRGLVFDTIYRDAKYKQKRISNLIYDLKRRDQDATEGFPPRTDAMLKVVDIALGMPTLLWFTSEEQLPALVSAGQVTMCFNLLQHIARLRLLGKDLPAEVGRVEQRARELWDQLRGDPQVLLRERMKGRLTPLTLLTTPPSGLMGS